MNFRKWKTLLLLLLVVILSLKNIFPLYSEEYAFTSKDKKLYKQQLEIAKTRFDKADKLLKEGIISKVEYQKLKQKYTNTKKLYELILNGYKNVFEPDIQIDTKKSLIQKNTYKKLVRLYNDGIISQKELLEAEINYKLSYIKLNKFRYASDFSLMSKLLPNPIGIILKTPLKYISSNYGYRNHPITGNYLLHTGVDIAAPYGVPVYAYENGLVESCVVGDKTGKMINISHGNGYNSIYMHLKDFSVSPNQFVSRGQIIGHVGTTGLSTGSHLHFEIRKNNSAQNINCLFKK